MSLATWWETVRIFRMAAVDHLVFVDFENVPGIDLAGVEGKSVRVVLLIGTKQKKLDLPLVQQIHRLGPSIGLIEVGAAGRNALDLVMAYHLGLAATEHAGARCYIVSQDKDFDALIAHLKARKVVISRHASFAGLPFLATKRVTPPKPPPMSAKSGAAPHVAGPTPLPAANPPPAPERMEKIVERLRQGINRPKTRATLARHLAASFGKTGTPGDVDEAITRLTREGLLAVDENGKVSYR